MKQKAKKKSKNSLEEKNTFHELSTVIINGDKVKINQKEYRIVINKRDALDTDMLREKYDPYLDQYDYLVGDISSEHLRLKGFYNDFVKTTIDRKKSTIADYLTEYCNPGSPYFILESVMQSQRPKIKKSKRRNPNKKRWNNRKEKEAFSKKYVHKTKVPRKNATAVKKRQGHYRSFVIRKKKKS